MKNKGLRVIEWDSRSVFERESTMCKTGFLPDTCRNDILTTLFPNAVIMPNFFALRGAVA
ncbi:MAG: hypothetical protein HZC10_05665 [Nitrospirae bacterium]|nr:hypothetical protein [Nitrospirota bacterium]